MSQTFGNLKDLSRLMGGAVQERWEDALGRMTRNILDPNTEPRRARKITMVLTIKPTESRDGGEMSFDVKESFAPPTPVKQSVFFDQTDDGTIYAMQKLNQVAGQLDMAGNVQPEAVSMPIGTTEDEPQDEQGTMPQIVSFRAKERSL